MNKKPPAEAERVAAYLPTFDKLIGLKNLTLLLLSWITLTISCFSRGYFGERMITPERVVLAYVTMKTFGFFLWLGLGLSGLISDGIGVGTLMGGIRLPGLYMAWFNLYGLLVLLACFCHWGWIQWMRWRGEVWYSKSTGISRFNFLIWLSRLQPLRFLHISDGLLYRFIEPAIWFWIGSWLKGNLDPVTGLYIQIAAVALLIEGNQQYRYMRNQILEQQDAEIEAAFFDSAREGAPKKETAGFSLVAPAAIPLQVKAHNESELETLIESVAGASS